MTLQYIDEENDRINILSQNDLNEAINCSIKQQQTSLKLFVIGYKNIMHENMDIDDNNNCILHPTPFQMSELIPTKKRNINENIDENIDDNNEISVGLQRNESKDTNKKCNNRNRKCNIRKGFVCNFCGKKCTSNWNLKSHINNIHKAKRYQCKECNKIFGMKHLLVRHSAIHLDVKPYQCDVCHRRFGRVDYLTNHEMRVHNKT
eukprot:232645_1